MSQPEDAITYIFTWHAHGDELTCEKCRHLNGKWWRDQDLFQERLWDPIWGDIWDLDADHSLAHPNCRCQLEVRTEVHLEELEEYVTLQELLKAFGI